MSTQTMAIVAGVLIGAVFVVIPIVLMSPKKTHDPHDGMAVGCLMMFLVAMLVPAGLLIYGVVGNHPKLVRFMFWATVLPNAWAAFGIVTDKTIKSVRKRRWDREDRERAERERREGTASVAESSAPTGGEPSPPTDPPAPS